MSRIVSPVCASAIQDSPLYGELFVIGCAVCGAELDMEGSMLDDLKLFIIEGFNRDVCLLRTMRCNARWKLRPSVLASASFRHCGSRLSSSLACGSPSSSSSSNIGSSLSSFQRSAAFKLSGPFLGSASILCRPFAVSAVEDVEQTKEGLQDSQQEMPNPHVLLSNAQVSVQERRAASWALATYLREKKGFKAAEASAIQRAAPMFATKLVLIARNAVKSSMSEMPVTDLVKVMATLVLEEQRINVAEAILESLGANVKWVEETISLMDTSDSGIRNVLGIVDRLHNIGFARKRMWVLFNSNRRLWESSPADIESSVVALKKLSVGNNKDLTKAIHCCPLLIGCNSQELLDGLISELGRMAVDPKEVFNLLMFFQTSNELRPVTDILSEHGISREDACKCLASAALTWVTQCNRTLASVKEWFLKHGIEEHVFWKLALHNPTDICRSPDSLEEQVNKMMEFGLSHSEAFHMLTKHSYYLVWNNNVFQPKLEYLVKTMGYPIQVLLTYPKYLACSLEHKVKPRHQLMEWLEREGCVEKPNSLTYFFQSEEAFVLTYGNRHPDALSIYKRAQAEATLNEANVVRFPVGSVEAGVYADQGATAFPSPAAGMADLKGVSRAEIITSSTSLTDTVDYGIVQAAKNESTYMLDDHEAGLNAALKGNAATQGDSGIYDQSVSEAGTGSDTSGAVPLVKVEAESGARIEMLKDGRQSAAQVIKPGTASEAESRSEEKEAPKVQRKGILGFFSWFFSKS